MDCGSKDQKKWGLIVTWGRLRRRGAKTPKTGLIAGMRKDRHNQTGFDFGIGIKRAGASIKKKKGREKGVLNHINKNRKRRT